MEKLLSFSQLAPARKKGPFLRVTKNDP